MGIFRKKLEGRKVIISFVLAFAMILSGVFFMQANCAEAKKLKVESFPGQMEVGQKKAIKANQVVQWSSLNKNITVETKKKARKVTICAKKKGAGILVAQKGKKKVKVKIQIKEKQVPQDNTEQKEIMWEDVMQKGVYIIAISGDRVEFATTKNGELSKYMILDDTIEIIKNGQVVSKDFLEEGQYVKVEYEGHQDAIGGLLWGCKTVAILESSTLPAEKMGISLNVNSFNGESGTINYSIISTFDKEKPIPTFFLLERLEDGQWITVSRKTNEVTADAMLLMPGDTNTLEANLYNIFNIMEDGKYRIAIPAEEIVYSSEFEIKKV